MSTATATLTRQVQARRRADQIGRVVMVFFLIITAAIYLVVPFVALDYLQQPFLGVFMEYPNRVNRALLAPFSGSTSIGTSLDLINGDQILSVDGTSINGASDLLRTLENKREGQRVEIEVIDRNGSFKTRYAVLQRLRFGLAFGLFAVPYLTGIGFLAIGLWVHRHRRDQAIGRTFTLLTCAVALILVTLFDLWTTHVFVRLWVAAIPLASGILMIFALVFPTEVAPVAKHPAMRWLPITPALLLIVITQWLVGLRNINMTQVWFYQYWFAVLSVVVFISVIFARSIFARSPSVREQSRVALAGSLIAFAPFVAFAFQVTVVPLSWMIALSLLFPLVIAYSIVQYSVLDTTRTLSFGTTYAIMAIGVTIGYGAIIAGLSLILGIALNEIAANPAMIAIFSFTLVMIFQPIHNWLQSRVDNFFFRTRGAYNERLTIFRQELTDAASLGEIVRHLKRQVRESLQPTHMYVFLRNSNTGDFVSIGEGRRPDTDIQFEPSSGLVHALSTTRSAIFLELNKPLPPELIGEHARLAVLRTPVLVPLQGQDRLAGWVSVGEKRSGSRYDIHDLRFIQALTEQASLAVERAQVIGDLERRVRELDVLRQVSQAVNFAADPDDLMDLIYHQSSKLIDTTNFYIIVHNEQFKMLSYAFYVESDERRTEFEGSMWPENLGLAAEVIRSRREILTDNYRTECARRGVRPRDTGHQAWMGVPLHAGARTLGALIVASYVQGVFFTRDQLKAFSAIADQAATALEKARLFQETEERARQLQILNEISKELSSTLDLESVLIRIMKSAVDILNTEAGSLFLVEEETGDLVFRVVEGGALSLVGEHIPAGSGIVGAAAASGEPVISNEASHDPLFYDDVDQETRFTTQSLLAVPLRLQDESIGVLEVINKKDGSQFNTDDAALLTTFAAQAAIAIQNASLYAATDAALQDRIDELQNLQRIDRELNRKLDFDTVINATLQWAIRTTGASAGTIGMVNAEGNGLDLLAATGYREDFLENHQDKPVPLSWGIAGRVLANGRAEFSRHVQDDPYYIDAARDTTVAQITVPILRGNQPIGVLVLESDVAELFTDDDFAFIQRLVEHAAVAIDNARLIQGIEQANRDKTQFISTVAHELKNPMTSIRGYTDLLKGGQVGEVTDMQVQFLGTIRSNVDRMTRLVSDLSDMARIETGHMRLEMSPISVKDVIDDTVRGMQSQIEEKNQTLNLDVPEDLPKIFADQTRMIQVMTNLVSNAYKYTPEGGEIWVGAALETEETDTNGKREIVHHWVKDTGIGMDEEELGNLFQKFYRTQRGKGMAQGTGLGLNITKNLVESHGGRIWVESTVGEGTSFHYTIPIATGSEEEESPEA